MKKMLVAAGVLAVITGVVAAVCKNRKIIGFLYCLLDGDICRGNYVLVSKQHRNIGAGRAS